MFAHRQKPKHRGSCWTPHKIEGETHDVAEDFLILSASAMLGAAVIASNGAFAFGPPPIGGPPTGLGGPPPSLGGLFGAQLRIAKARADQIVVHGARVNEATAREFDRAWERAWQTSYADVLVSIYAPSTRIRNARAAQITGAKPWYGLASQVVNQIDLGRNSSQIAPRVNSMRRSFHLVRQWRRSLNTLLKLAIGRKEFTVMTIPDYVAFGVLIVLLVMNAVALFADRNSAWRQFPLFDKSKPSSDSAANITGAASGRMERWSPAWHQAGDCCHDPCSERQIKGCEASTLPLPVNLVITELAVIEPSDQGLVLKERAPGVTVEKIIAATEALLIILAISPPQVREMANSA
jgi:hypothetical protein